MIIISLLKLIYFYLSVITCSVLLCILHVNQLEDGRKKMGGNGWRLFGKHLGEGGTWNKGSSSWYQAVRNPLCWENIIFPPMLRTPSSQTELIKFVVNRSQRRATILALPYSCDREALLYVSEEWASNLHLKNECCT